MTQCALRQTFTAPSHSPQLCKMEQKRGHTHRTHNGQAGSRRAAPGPLRRGTQPWAVAAKHRAPHQKWAQPWSTPHPLRAVGEGEESACSWRKLRTGRVGTSPPGTRHTCFLAEQGWGPGWETKVEMQISALLLGTHRTLGHPWPGFLLCQRPTWGRLWDKLPRQRYTVVGGGEGEEGSGFWHSLRLGCSSIPGAARLPAHQPLPGSAGHWASPPPALVSPLHCPAWKPRIPRSRLCVLPLSPSASHAHRAPAHSAGHRSSVTPLATSALPSLCPEVAPATGLQTRRPPSLFCLLRILFSLGLLILLRTPGLT